MTNICKTILWEESIFSVDLEKIDNDKIIEHYHELKKEDPIGVSNSNNGGWQKMLAPGKCKELDGLLIDLECAASEIFNKTYKRKEQLVISNCWFNGNSYGDHNSVHTHPGSVLSGVYYLTDGKPEHGQIHFQRSNYESVHSFRFPSEQLDLAESNHPDHIGLDYTTTASFIAKASRALFFGSWMQHGVSTNRTNDTRIVIGLNFYISGKEDLSPFDYHEDDNYA